MTIDPRLERLYQQVELVSGAGDPRRGRFCVMSFAAFLAGEEHSDSPAAASPLVRKFAVSINDAMPYALRQRLKPLVPRIIGTRDGRDTERAALVARAAQAEILPCLAEDFPRPTGLAQWWHERELCRLRERLFAAVRSETREEGGRIVLALAQLLCFCARRAPVAERRAWYWNEAIGLLDRMCDIRNDERAAPLVRTYWRYGERCSARPGTVGRGREIGREAARYLRALLPWSADT